MRLAFRRPQYAKLGFEPDGSSFVEEYSDDASLEPQILWRDEVDDDDEEDLEMGGIQMSPNPFRLRKEGP